MSLAILLAALVLAAMVPVLLPLVRGARGVTQETAAFDRAVYRDQLREVDRDIARGLLTETEGASIRLEVQRRLLSVPDDTAPVRTGKARVLAAAAFLITASGAGALYLRIGAPDPPRASGPEAALIRLTEHLRQNPGDSESWALYARTVSRLDRWDDAETAWRRVIALGQATPDAVASLGEVLVLREGGTVGAEAHGLFEMALRGDPKNDMARFYLALAEAQGGNAQGALDRWRAQLDDMAPDSPGRQDVMRQMEETARAAGLPLPPQADRSAMILGMVDQLAARLAKEPGDEAGWERLGRSYAVLGRGEASADAYEKAAALKPSDPGLKLRAAEALMANLKPTDAIPPRALALLRGVESAVPNEPAVLWYLGLAAARAGDRDHARDYWTRLTKVLPPDSEDVKMVGDALNALSQGQ